MILINSQHSAHLLVACSGLHNSTMYNYNHSTASSIRTMLRRMFLSMNSSFFYLLLISSLLKMPHQHPYNYSYNNHPLASRTSMTMTSIPHLASMSAPSWCHLPLTTYSSSSNFAFAWWVIVLLVFSCSIALVSYITYATPHQSLTRHQVSQWHKFCSAKVLSQGFIIIGLLLSSSYRYRVSCGMVSSQSQAIPPLHPFWARLSSSGGLSLL